MTDQRVILSSNDRALSDEEVGKLYAFCLDDTRVYNLLRRLVKYGQREDPTHSNETGVCCTGCEGTPSGENNPCAVCGKHAQKASEGQS